jgi:hypothetical protein
MSAITNTTETQLISVPSLLFSCLYSLMATLEEEINDLKQKIRKYEAKMDDATTTETWKERYANLITERGKTLNILHQQQLQLQGKTIIIAYQFNIAAFKLILSLGSPLSTPLISLSCSFLSVI